jgi:hypothetical protein
VIFDGPCPFLTCLDTDVHAHPECPACGAVRYGNSFCPTCVSTWPDSAFKTDLLAVLAERDDTP